MNAPAQVSGNATAATKSRFPKVCIVGAGSSGIVCCKIFREHGIPYDCFEAGSQVGGMWVFKNTNGMSSAYRSLHINTSRRRMEFQGFPMPDEYPDFPSHVEIAKYFSDFVDHYQLRDSITFNTKVEHCERKKDGGWRVTLATGETREYDALVVANGHHWDPHWPQPDFPGTFNGIKVHSHHYIDPLDPHDLRDKTVVVIGFGNSAMDIACELGQKSNAKKVYLSTRSGGYIYPKYLGSMPFDEILRHPSEKPSLIERFIRTFIPEKVVEVLLLPVYHWLIRSRVGEPWDYGLPTPKHAFGHTHPTISNEIHIRMGSGDVVPKTNIRKLDGNIVEFEDGSRVEADALIYCTGYKISFPFLDSTTIEAKDNDIALYQRIFDPKTPDLLFLALVQPLCAMMPIAEEQSKLMAAYLTGQYLPPSPEDMTKEMVAEHEEMKAKFTHSKRHTIEIDCQKYTYYLWKEFAKGRKRAAKAGHPLPVPPRVS